WPKADSRTSSRLDDLPSQEELGERDGAGEAEQRDEQRHTEVRTRARAHAEHQQAQHAVDVHRVERKDAILRGRPLNDADGRERRRDRETRLRKPNCGVEDRIHSNTSISGLSYRPLMRSIHSCSSMRSSTWIVNSVRSSVSSTQIVPGVAVMIIANTAKPCGSRMSIGM